MLHKLNKIYLISLVIWILILTNYVLYVSLKKQENIDKYQKLFFGIGIVSFLIVLLTPLNVLL